MYCTILVFLCLLVFDRVVLSCTKALTTLRQKELPTQQLHGLHSSMPVMNSRGVVSSPGTAVGSGSGSGAANGSGPSKGDKSRGLLQPWELASLVQAPLPLARLQQVMLVRKRRAEIRTVGLQIATHMLSTVSFPLVRAQIVRRLHGAPWPAQMLGEVGSARGSLSKNEAASRTGRSGGKRGWSRHMPDGKVESTAANGLFGTLDSGLQVTWLVFVAQP